MGAKLQGLFTAKNENCIGWLTVYIPGRIVAGDRIYPGTYFLYRKHLNREGLSFDVDVPDWLLDEEFMIEIMDGISLHRYEGVKLHDGAVKYYEMRR